MLISFASPFILTFSNPKRLSKSSIFQDTLGESILICTEQTSRAGIDLLTAELKPIVSCLDAGSSVSISEHINNQTIIIPSIESLEASPVGSNIIKRRSYSRRH